MNLRGIHGVVLILSLIGFCVAQAEDRGITTVWQLAQAETQADAPNESTTVPSEEDSTTNTAVEDDAAATIDNPGQAGDLLSQDAGSTAVEEQQPAIDTADPAAADTAPNETTSNDTTSGGTIPSDTVSDTTGADAADDSADTTAVEATAQSNTVDDPPPTDSSSTDPLPTDSADVSDDEDSRRVRRLEITHTNEWNMDLDVPMHDGASELDIPATNLPNADQDAQLQDFLVRLAFDPEDAEARSGLDQLLGDVVAQANNALAQGNLTQARRLRNAITTVQPDHPGVASLNQQLQIRAQIASLLDSAQTAVDEARYVSPEEDNALAHYNAILALDETNADALQGLQNVRQALVDRAMELAQQSDFETAAIYLDQASLVPGDDSALSDARNQLIQLGDEALVDAASAATDAIDAGNFDQAEGLLTQLVALGGDPQQIASLRSRLEDARLYGGFQPGQIIVDPLGNTGLSGPSMVVISAGSFLMGSPDDESDRASNEGPRRRVTFNRGFAIGQHEISVAEFRQFVDETGYRTDAERLGDSRIYDEDTGTLVRRADVDWSRDFRGERADDGLPVIHVSWNDAVAYADWLTQQTLRAYRLPSESEFEYVLRSGSQTMYWWGNGVPQVVVENTTGDRDVSESRRRWTAGFRRYEDGFWGPAPVASFAVNTFGLYDMGGNVSEWVQDCWHDTYVQAPVDQSAWVNPGCNLRVIRGGSWSSSPEQARSAFRLAAQTDTRGSRVGFRLARDL